jgi:hypothetical protein
LKKTLVTRIVPVSLVLVSAFACSRPDHGDSATEAAASDPAAAAAVAPGGASPADAISVTAAEAQLVGVRAVMPKCPAGAVCEPSSELTFEFDLGGCVDRLGPVYYERSAGKDGKTEYRITGHVIHTKASMLARCIAAPKARVAIMDRPFLSKDDVTVKPLARAEVLAKLPSDAKAIASVDARLVSVRTEAPHCPAGAMCEPSTELTFALPLGGCVDRLLSVTYDTEFASDGTLDVRIAGLVARTKGSESTKCIVAPMATWSTRLMGIISESSVRVSPIGKAN